MAAPTDCPAIELGFVEKAEPWRLLSHFFPSKVGGKPAWLALNPLPSVDELKCRRCAKPSVCLIQIYAPLKQHPDTCFHRTLYIFVCKDPACCKPNDGSNFVVLRSQLSRQNEFYSATPPDEDGFNAETEYPTAEMYQPLCLVCGSAGPKSCARCHKATYCSKEHQTIAWRAGHKQTCSQTEADDSSVSPGTSSILFPEQDVVIEPEDYEEPTEKSEDEKMAEYKKFMDNKTSPGSVKDQLPMKDLEAMAVGGETSAVDKQFKKFKKRMDHEPEQVLRYSLGGQPLWASNLHSPESTDIPACGCGAPRHFEFQVMPQLLNHLKVDRMEHSLDWGTLAIYTCINSCQGAAPYQTEFLWKQDFSADNATA